MAAVLVFVWANTKQEIVRLNVGPTEIVCVY